MNKFLSIIAAAALAAVMITGCESGGSAQTASSGSDTASASDSGEAMTGDGTKSPEGYSKDLDGFVKYMTDNEFVSGEGVDLTAAAIGAASGKRFTVTSGVTKHTVELYEYTDQSSELAQKTIKNARKDGSFHLFESTENVTQYTLAAVSEDGRFLMLYTDASDSEDKNEQKTAAAEAVKNFSSGQAPGGSSD